MEYLYAAQHADAHAHGTSSWHHMWKCRLLHVPQISKSQVRPHLSPTLPAEHTFTEIRYQLRSCTLDHRCLKLRGCLDSASSRPMLCVSCRAPPPCFPTPHSLVLLPASWLWRATTLVPSALLSLLRPKSTSSPTVPQRQLQLALLLRYARLLTAL